MLHEKGVSIMLAGNMGNGALNVLNHHGITVYRGCSGDTEQLVKLFLSEGVKDSGEGCHTHVGEHTCNHHH